MWSYLWLGSCSSKEEATNQVLPGKSKRNVSCQLKGVTSHEKGNYSHDFSTPPLSSPAIADQIVLKNGDRLTGKIVKSDGSKLVVQTELVGEVSVDLSAVNSITSDQPLYVTLADGRTVSGILTASENKAELLVANANAVSIDRSTIRVIRSEAEHLAYERSLDPGWLDYWSGGADIGFALTSGNSDTTTFALGLGMTRETRRDKTTIYAASVYNRDSTSGESRTVANTIRGGVRYDRDFNARWFAYGFVDLEDNGLQDLTLRLVPGGGIGYHAIRNERTKLDLLAGSPGTASTSKATPTIVARRKHRQVRRSRIDSTHVFH